MPARHACNDVVCLSPDCAPFIASPEAVQWTTMPITLSACLRSKQAPSRRLGSTVCACHSMLLIRRARKSGASRSCKRTRRCLCSSGSAHRKPQDQPPQTMIGTSAQEPARDMELRRRKLRERSAQDDRPFSCQFRLNEGSLTDGFSDLCPASGSSPARFTCADVHVSSIEENSRRSCRSRMRSPTDRTRDEPRSRCSSLHSSSPCDRSATLGQTPIAVVHHTS